MAKYIIFFFLIILLSTCQRSSNPLEIVENYQNLENQHDVEQLLALFSKDAQLNFGPMGVITGQEQIQNIHEYDRALNTNLQMDSCRIDGKKVICQVIEHNDWLRAAGINRLIFTKAEYTISDNNQISAISVTLAPASADSLRRALGSLDTWARKNVPEMYSALFQKDGRFNYSYESGKQILSIIQQWQASAQKK